MTDEANQRAAIDADLSDDERRLQNFRWQVEAAIGGMLADEARRSERVDYWVHITWSAIIVIVGTLLGVGLTALVGLVGYFIFGTSAGSLSHMIGLLP